ncbi:MAG: hypothetical protein PHT21_09880 [Lachnospiraceae bacterium]|nr:hypothetical protein [Lachnospiraceae bacterium]
MKRNKKQSNLFKTIQNYSVEITVFLYLLFQLIFHVSKSVYGFVTAWYVTDYSIGVSSRLLVGSILRILFGDYITAEQVYIFLILTFIVLILLVSILSGYMIRKTTDSVEKTGAVFLLAMYLASPAAPGYLWVDENMGRLDTFLYFLTLILIVVAFKVKNQLIRYSLLGILGVVCVLTHQVYFFLFFPVLLTILLQDWFESDFKKTVLLGAVLVITAVAVVFLFFQFGGGVNYSTPEELTSVLQSRTNLPISNSTILYEYFWTIKDHFVNNMLPELRERVRFGIITVVLLAPVFIIYLSLWIKAIYNASVKKDKIKYLLILFTNVLYIPVFALMTDWGRWFAAFITVQCFSFLYLTGVRDKGIKNGLVQLGDKIRKYPFLFVSIILYLSLFDKFEAINYLPQVETFYYTIYNIKTIILAVL